MSKANRSRCRLSSAIVKSAAEIRQPVAALDLGEPEGMDDGALLAIDLVFVREVVQRKVDADAVGEYPAQLLVVARLVDLVRRKEVILAHAAQRAIATRGQCARTRASSQTTRSAGIPGSRFPAAFRDEHERVPDVRGATHARK
jgi:hypothetical protein